jgi:hypothetical protein
METVQSPECTPVQDRRCRRLRAWVAADPESRGLLGALFFWIALRFRLDATDDYTAADRVERKCPAWARFLRRRAAKLWSLADDFCPDAYVHYYPPHCLRSDEALEF